MRSKRSFMGFPPQHVKHAPPDVLPERSITNSRSSIFDLFRDKNPRPVRAGMVAFEKDRV